MNSKRHPSSRQHGTLKAALKLHDRGLWVVPCNGKIATKTRWSNKRVNRRELERKLDADPELGIGIVLSRSPYIDVEYDSDDGEAALRKLFGAKIPKTPAWRSKRGTHRLFRRPNGLPARAVIHLDGIEFRIGNGKGALSVVPPSNGRRWVRGQSLDDLKPAKLPQHVVERLTATESKPHVLVAKDDAIPEGQRNETLFALACAMRRGLAS